MINKSEIETIVQQCIAEDRKAQKRVYESYYERYFALCKRYLGRHDIAADVLNKTFYQIFTNIKSLKNPYLFEGWMKQICINTCLNEIKKNKKNMIINIDDSAPSALPQIDNEGLENLEMEDLLAMVMELPWRMRSVFNLYVIDGYKHNEICEQLNISIGTSKFHLHQARIKLQEIIERHFHENDLSQKVKTHG